MSAKEIQFDQQARESIRRGVARLARAVKGTLGPCGRVVVLGNQWGPPTITKDGATVASHIELEDPVENIGAQMIKEVAARSAKDAGDGTTTATIYAEAIFSEGLRNVASGAHPFEIRRGINKAVQAVVNEFKRMSKPIQSSNEIAQVGTCASHQDEEIGQLIADAMQKVGKHGVITVEDGQTQNIELQVLEGIQFAKGYISPHFVTSQAKMNCTLDDAYILIHDKKIASAQDLLPLLNKVSDSGKPLFIISEKLSSDVLATLVVNHIRGSLKVCAVKSPGFGDRRKDVLEDIATMIGGKAIWDELGLDITNVQLSDLGTAKRIVIDADTTTIIEGKGQPKAIKDRIETVKRQLEKVNSEFEKETLEERLARLNSGIAQINVGGATESAMQETKSRVEDAVNACRAATEEGVLPGGGVAPIRARKVLKSLKSSCIGDEWIGVEIVQRALSAPIKQIAANAGHNGSVVADLVERAPQINHGFNAMTEQYGDMIAMGVLVPTKVERIALQNAASVAGLLLTTAAVVSDAVDTEHPGHIHDH